MPEFWASAAHIVESGGTVARSGPARHYTAVSSLISAQRTVDISETSAFSLRPAILMSP